MAMKVVKKSGKVEEYLPGKLADSVRKANEKTEEVIDVDGLLRDFARIAEGKEHISTGDIDIITYGLLYSKGFHQTLLTYISFDEKDKE